MMERKYHWYVIYILLSTPSGKLHKSIYSGFENKNLTLNDLNNIEISGKEEDDTWCICNVSYLGYMTQELFKEG